MSQSWLDLVKSENPDVQATKNLLITLADNKNIAGSAWFDLKLGARAWARLMISQGLIPTDFVKYVSRL